MTKSTWLIDGRSIAKKVKDATTTKKEMINSTTDYEPKRECPTCHYWIDNSDVDDEWPGLPCGVKFNPSDIQLLDHLAAKCGVSSTPPHLFIDEFIPTLDNDNGICYTHPKDLPGTREDDGSSSAHFFHKTRNAYGSSNRKRRKISSSGNCSNTTDFRWHKTGKTKAVIHKGVIKGWKKIMVLYNCCKQKKAAAPVKSNWVMHQYHLGSDENEKEGEYVVSKIFYKQHREVQEESTVSDGEKEYSTTTLGLMVDNPNTPVLNNPVGRSSPCSTTNVSGGMYDCSNSLLMDDDDDDGGSSYYELIKHIVMPPESTGNNIISFTDPPKEDLHNSNDTHAFLEGGLQQAAGDLEANAAGQQVVDTVPSHISGLTQPQDPPPHDFFLTDMNFDSHDSMFGWF